MYLVIFQALTMILCIFINCRLLEYLKGIDLLHLHQNSVIEGSFKINTPPRVRRLGYRIGVIRKRKWSSGTSNTFFSV